MESFVSISEQARSGNYADKVRRRAESLAGKQNAMKLAMAEELCAALDRTGTSRAELARRAGVSPQYITKVFRGTTNFTLESVVALFFHVGCELEMTVRIKEEAADYKNFFVAASSQGTERFRPYVAEFRHAEESNDPAIAA